MGRQALRITIVLGSVITLLGGTGIFAVFNDRATAGPNTVTSGERPRAADLVISAANPDPTSGMFNCETYVDDLAGPLITATNVQPGATAGDTWLCLKNAGSGTAEAVATVIDLTDTDLGCTGDEAAAGDSCDQPGDPGELGSLLLLDYELVECDTLNQGQFNILSGVTNSPATFAAAPWDFTGTPMAPGDVLCFHVIARYRSDVTEQQAQLAQSDQVSWSFAFDATVQ